jgi:hypothetical protein
MAVAPYSTFTYKNPYIAQAKLSVTKAIFVQDLSSRPEILHKISHRNLVLLICDRTGLNGDPTLSQRSQRMTSKSVAQ